MGLEALAAPGRKANGNARAFAGVFVFALFALGLGGCASLVPQTAALREGLPPDLPPTVELKSVPFFPQTEYQCGPAALATVLADAGEKVTPEELVPQVYLPERKGSLQVEMLAAARRHGMVSYLLAPRFTDMLREIASGTPVIVLWDQSPLGTWHYAVAMGYDYDKGKLLLRSGTDERDQKPFAIHEFLWMRSGYWAMVAVPPNRIPVSAEETRWLSAVAALEHAGQTKPAQVAYETFLKRWPNNTSAAIGLANTYYAMKDLPQAERVLREAARRDPDSVIVLNNLAQTLSDEGKDDEALGFIDRAAAAGGPYAGAVADTRKSILAKIAAKKKD
ncbi:MAG: PA2778 family cysteine peptidase [Betaproteobacteria bacterium]|nr:PA2778 family cysteine peptidase [Betaproteobacteria bacterium]